MISIAEMKELAEKDREIENQSKKVKYEKDLAMYRARLKEVKPKFMEYIEKCIYNGLKYNNKIGLYKSNVNDMFNPVNKYGTNILVVLANPAYEAQDAYDVALKELAEEVRKELFEAGVKDIVKNSNNSFLSEPYLFLEV